MGGRAKGASRVQLGRRGKGRRCSTSGGDGGRGWEMVEGNCSPHGAVVCGEGPREHSSGADVSSGFWQGGEAEACSSAKRRNNKDDEASERDSSSCTDACKVPLGNPAGLPSHCLP